MPDRIPPTAKVADSFYLLNLGFVASYLYDAGDSLVAFDAGMNPRKALMEMRKLDLDPAKVGALLFTHSDPDHTGGIKAFPNAKAYFSLAEVAMFDRSTARFFGRVYSKPPRFAYATLEDGQELKIGDAAIRCILTPGHTAGSMSFLVDGSILIVGDELNLKEGKAVLDRKFIGIDNEKRLDSIHKLAKLRGVEYICPAHSGYSEDFQAAMADWKAD
jgi:hydroxyacylglutathione hydrolase